MQMRITDIIVKDRIRKDLGDLSDLMASLRQYGLMNPVVVNRNHELIAGERRLESAKRLGWRTIQVLILDKETKSECLELEIEENLHRKALTGDELTSAYERLQKLQNPSFFRKLWQSIVNFFSKLITGKNVY